MAIRISYKTDFNLIKKLNYSCAIYKHRQIGKYKSLVFDGKEVRVFIKPLVITSGDNIEWHKEICQFSNGWYVFNENTNSSHRLSWHSYKKAIEEAL